MPIFQYCPPALMLRIFKVRRKRRLTVVFIFFLLCFVASKFLEVGILFSDFTTARHLLYHRNDAGSAWRGNRAMIHAEPSTPSLAPMIKNEANTSELRNRIQNCYKVPRVQCGDLYRGNGSTIRTSRRFIKLANCELSDLTIDCPTFRKELGYAVTALSEKERKFPIAYSIRMHKDPEQVEMLLRAIYAPQNIYCIYIDKQSPARVHSAMESLIKCFDNVFMATNVEPFYYATSSQMRADLQCMRDLVRKDYRWKYYLNLAGQEFPLKTNREIVEILELLRGTNDIEVGEYLEGWAWRYRNHVVPHGQNWFLLDGSKSDTLGLNLTFFKGSAYGAFSRKFVEFILEDMRAQRLITWLNDTFAPEETLFATLNALPDAPGGYPVYVDQSASVGEHISRVVIWKWTKIPSCRGRYQRNVCILSSGDLHWLMRRKQLFANKFDINYDLAVVQCLLREILDRRQTPTMKNLEYYRKLPHVKFGNQRLLRH